MSTVERQRLEYETELLKELLTLQMKVRGRVDDETYETFVTNVQKLYH